MLQKFKRFSRNLVNREKCDVETLDGQNSSFISHANCKIFFSGTHSGVEFQSSGYFLCLFYYLLASDHLRRREHVHRLFKTQFEGKTNLASECKLIQFVVKLRHNKFKKL